MQLLGSIDFPKANKRPLPGSDNSILIHPQPYRNHILWISTETRLTPLDHKQALAGGCHLGPALSGKQRFND